MYQTETVNKPQEVVTAIVCDKCGRVIPRENEIEFQEAYRIDFIGGYGSIFGDGDHVICDLCQQCLQELIGAFHRWAEGES